MMAPLGIIFTNVWKQGKKGEVLNQNGKEKTNNVNELGEKVLMQGNNGRT